MPGSSSLGQALLVAILLVGTAGLIGPASTVATFTDTETGTGNVTAAVNFGGGGGTGLTADAGGSYAVDEGNSITLDGSGSTIQRGNIRTYEWQILSGPGTLTPTTGAQVTYNAPANVASDTDVTVELTVTDNKGNTDTDRATVTVRDV